MKDRIDEIVKLMIIASGVFVVLASFSVTRQNAAARADAFAEVAIAEAPARIAVDSTGHE